MDQFPISYDEIILRIDSIDPINYSKTRNYTDGAVTHLSPYISRGVITLKQLQAAVSNKGYEKYEIERFIQELSWREYFQRVWQAKMNLIDDDLKFQQSEVKHSKMLTAVSNANTGIEALDIHIKNLYSSGYMHNHLRLYTASITCNIAGAHWSQPAKWLYYHLLDGDVASNQCSWQWVAGSFSSKKYYCNQENINRYAGTNQQDTFLDKPYEDLPGIETPKILKETIGLELTTSLPLTELPTIDEERTTLIYNSYNLDPLWRKDEDVNRILLLEKSHFEHYPVSEKVLNFIIALSGNIKDIQLYCGEFKDLKALYKEQQPAFIFKEHPASYHYQGTQDKRDWLFEDVEGFYPSFSNYWKRCKKTL